jgi:cytochrome b6-f complex iron-sulfur subunit
MADAESTEESGSERRSLSERQAALATATSGGHAVVIARPAAPPGMALPKMSRRAIVRTGWWAGVFAMLGGIAIGLLDFMWSRTAQKLGGTFVLDVNANDIQPGEKRDVVALVPDKLDPLANLEAKIFLVRLDDTQAQLNGDESKSGAYLALSRKCPHLGCTVPYVPSFTFPDPANGNELITGWFRCPCHGSTYSDVGRRVFGPAPRSMDVYALTVADDGTMTLDLSKLFQGGIGLGANIEHAVFPGQAEEA